VHRYGSLLAVDPRVRPRGYHQGGRLPEDILGMGRSGRSYALQAGETVTARDQPLLDDRSARKLARYIGDELVARGVGALNLDSRRVEQLLAGARLSNARR